MVYINSCDFHPRNEFYADRCRDNSCAGVSRDDFAGVSRDDAAGVSRDDCAGASRNASRVRHSRNESRADGDSRNEPSMYVGSRNGLCVEVDLQRDDETFLDVRKDDVTFLDVRTDGVTLPLPCSSSSVMSCKVCQIGHRSSSVDRLMRVFRNIETLPVLLMNYLRSREQKWCREDTTFLRRYLREDENNEGFLQKARRYSRAQNGKFGSFDSCGSQSLW